MRNLIVNAWSAVRAERGQVFITVALAMVAFMAVCAFAVDASRLFVEKSHDQNAADAAALAGAGNAELDDQGKPICDKTEHGLSCWNAVKEYLGYNGAPTTECTQAGETGCFEAYVTDAGLVRVIVHTHVDPYFANVIGAGGLFDVAAKAAAGATPVGSPPTTSVESGSTTTAEGQYPTAIFARAQICSSFFIPGHDTEVSGVSVFGGIGNIGSGSIVHAVRMNFDFYPGQIKKCTYPGLPMVPVPPEFWNYDANGNPVGGTGPDAWPVPFPDREALFRSNDAHCLYTSSAVARKELQSGVATITMAKADCLRTGDTVIVLNVDDVFNGQYTITGTPSASSFTYARTRAPFTRTVKTKAMTNGIATLTTTAAHGLVVGDIVNISGVPVTNGIDFNGGPFVVTATPSTTTFSYATGGTQTLRATASGGTVAATGNVAPTTTTGTVTAGSLAGKTVGAGWTNSHEPGIYIVDAGNGVGMTISASNTNFDGYTFVAPEILVSGSQDTFTGFASASRSALFYAYDPNGDAVHVNGTTTGNVFNGSMFCGPPERIGTTDPQNKCWFGGNGTTFNGLMEAWHIEYTATNAVFNGTGPPIGGTSSTSYWTTTITIPGSVTGTTVQLGE
jgi:hypothetical protein